MQFGKLQVCINTPPHLSSHSEIPILVCSIMDANQVYNQGFMNQLSQIACGIKGRSIHDHLEVLTSLTEITNDKTVIRPGMAFLTVDQEKAFDRLEHNYLFQTLSALGFGPKFIRWAKILYHNIYSRDTRCIIQENTHTKIS